MKNFKSHALTKRDTSNMSLVAIVTGLLTWLFTTVLGWTVPPEVIASVTAIIVFLIARFTRY